MKKLCFLFLPFAVLLFISCSSGADLKPVIDNYSNIALASYQDALTDAQNL